ncbi:MAG: hypothetical protein A2Z15_06345 [Chloroflexi bacterium RBG_16_50_11]|nr:MAG: hypothetical protein A2Z15_06345 [Chloroflexi bacterium RBG_16_50_11]
MGFFKRHRIISAIIVFVIITLPSAINAYWSLYEKIKNVTMPSFDLGIGIWLLPLVGAVLAIIIIGQGQRDSRISKIELEKNRRL